MNVKKVEYRRFETAIESVRAEYLKKFEDTKVKKEKLHRRSTELKQGIFEIIFNESLALFYSSKKSFRGSTVMRLEKCLSNFKGTWAFQEYQKLLTNYLYRVNTFHLEEVVDLPGKGAEIGILKVENNSRFEILIDRKLLIELLLL